jgi:hypothetical protein
MAVTPYPSRYSAQPLDLTLSALADLPTQADTAPFFTDIDQAALMTVTPLARTLLEGTTPAEMRATLEIPTEFGTPTGTHNTVAFFGPTGSLASESELCYDGSTNSLAIGTTADPLARLRVQDSHSALVRVLFQPNSTWHGAVVIDPSFMTLGALTNLFGLVMDNPPDGIAATAVWTNIAAGAGRYNLWAQGTASNYFAGNVGIGTTTPGYPLSVLGRVNVSGSATYPASTASALRIWNDTYASVTLTGNSNDEFVGLTGGLAFNSGGFAALRGSERSVHAMIASLSLQGSGSIGHSSGLEVRLRQEGTATFETYGLHVTTSGVGTGEGNFYGLVVRDPTWPNVSGATGIFSAITAGPGRFNLSIRGTAPNYLEGTLHVNQPIGLQTVPLANYVFFDRWRKVDQHAIVLRPLDQDAGYAPIMFLNLAGATVGQIDTTASSTSYVTTSDARLKTAITPLTDALDLISLLSPVAYRWKSDNSPGHGFLAHELQEVVPEAVSGEANAVSEDGSIRPQGVDMSKLMPWVVGALKELLTRVELVEARL